MARLVLVDGKRKTPDGESSSTSATIHRSASTEGEAAKQLLEANGYLPRRQDTQNGQYEFNCPFHEEPGTPTRGRSTNFYLDRKTSKFACHSATCGEHGNLQVLERFFGLESDPAAYAQFKSLEAKLQTWQAALTNDRRKVFYESGLTDTTIDRFRLGFDETNKYGPCYVIPYLQGRRPHAIRYYSPEGTGPNGSKYWWEAGTESALFNAQSGCGDENGRVFIAEGEKKAMLLEQWGYHAVAVPGAQQWKRDWTHYLNHAREIFIVYDNDNHLFHIRPIDKCPKCRNKGLEECEGHNPGQEEAVKRKDELGFRAHNIVLPLPEGARKTDINEYVMRDKHSKSDFEIMLMGGDKVSPFLVRTLGDIFNEPPNETHFLVSDGLLPKGGRLLISGAPKVGKAQPLDTPVLTPDGFIPMGQITPGSDVIGSTGKPIRVTHVWPQGTVPIFRVTTSDGASTDACGDHLWQVQDRNHRKSGPSVIDTTTMQQQLLEGRELYLPLVQPVRFEEKSLPISPYALGALIGDGTFRLTSPAFSSGDQEMFELLAKSLPEFTVTRSGKCGAYISDPGRNGNRLKDQLKTLGLWGTSSHNKFIPHDYLHTLPTHRLALLQGLLDTDGGMEKCPVFCTTSAQLANDVVFLVESLGGTARRRTKVTSHLDAHVIRVRLPRELGSPFRLARKRVQWEAAAPKKLTTPTRRVVAVDYVGDRPAQCVTVDAPDSLYVTERFLVTHNSIFAENLALSLASGIPFLRKFEIADINSTPGVRTMLLDREVSERSLYDRLKMLIDDRPGYMAAMDNLFVDHKFRLTLDTDKAEEDMCNLIFANGAQVVILDTAYKFFAGDMNSQASVNKMFTTLDRVIERTGVSIILTHHHRKGTLSGQNGGPNADQVVGSFLWTGWPNGTVLLNFKERRVDQPFNTICSFVAFRDAAPPEPLVLFRGRDTIAYTSIEQWVPEDDEGDPFVQGSNKEKLSVASLANALIQCAPITQDSFLHMASGRYGCREDTVKPILAQVLDDYPDFVRTGSGSSKDPHVLKYRLDHIGDEPSEVTMVSAAAGFTDVDMFSDGPSFDPANDRVDRNTGEIE